MTQKRQITHRRSMGTWGAALLVTAISACVRAPAISVVDTKTALEQQAAGEFHDLENDLATTAITPHVEPIAGEQLAAAGSSRDTATLGEIARLYAQAQTDADWIDDMLIAACIGEARSGLLEATPAQCRAQVDAARLTRVLGRTNLHRRQVWQFVRTQQPNADDEQIVRTWRRLHLQRVVCGGLVQTSDDQWEPKSC